MDDIGLVIAYTTVVIAIIVIFFVVSIYIAKNKPIKHDYINCVKYLTAKNINVILRVVDLILLKDTLITNLSGYSRMEYGIELTGSEEIVFVFRNNNYKFTKNHINKRVTEYYKKNGELLDHTELLSITDSYEIVNMFSYIDDDCIHTRINIQYISVKNNNCRQVYIPNEVYNILKTY